MARILTLSVLLAFLSISTSKVYAIENFKNFSTGIEVSFGDQSSISLGLSVDVNLNTNNRIGVVLRKMVFNDGFGAELNYNYLIDNWNYFDLPVYFGLIKPISSSVYLPFLNITPSYGVVYSYESGFQSFFYQTFGIVIPVLNCEPLFKQALINFLYLNTTIGGKSTF